MKFKNIFTYALASLAIIMGSACKETEPKFTGNPNFVVEGVENNNIPMGANGTVNSADATGMTEFSSGTLYQISANGNWELIPVEKEGEAAWSRIFPLSGKDEGIIRVYAGKAVSTEQRVAEYRLLINGEEQPQRVTITQESVPVTFTFSANSISLKTKGGSATLSVAANIEWDVVSDPTATWLTVERQGNKILFNAPNSNDTGADLTTKIYVVGKAPHEDIRYEIPVTQVSALFTEDWGWFPEAKDATTGNVLSAPVCWITPSANRLDQWVGKGWIAKDKLEWSGVAGSQDGPRDYNWYNYLKMGTSDQTGNIVAPAIKTIQGEINARVSFNMTGFVTKKNVRSDGAMFYVALLGPGRITEATAGGTSYAKVITGQLTIPYLASGSGAKGVIEPDIELTEIAKFEIGANGYFDMNEPTGLKVWEAPEAAFSLRIEGMTAQTRVVIIAGEADKVNMTNGWLNNNGTCVSVIKCFDNYSVVAE